MTRAMGKQPTLRVFASRSRRTFKLYFRFFSNGYDDSTLKELEFVAIPKNCAFDDACPHKNEDGLLVFRIKDMQHVVRNGRDCYALVAAGSCGEGFNFMALHGFFKNNYIGSSNAIAEAVR